jgi:hypothetical protein
MMRAARAANAMKATTRDGCCEAAGGHRPFAVVVAVVVVVGVVAGEVVEPMTVLMLILSLLVLQ